MVKSVKTPKASDKKVQGTRKSAPKKVAKRLVSTPAKETVPVSKKHTNMFAAYRAFWSRGFTDWTGTTSRAEYWWTVLANLLLVGGICLFMWLMLIIGFSNGVTAFIGIIFVWLFLLYAFASIIPSISMCVRRLRDGGFSPWWVLLSPLTLLPYIGNVATLVLFVFTLMPTRADGQK